MCSQSSWKVHPATVLQVRLDITSLPCTLNTLGLVTEHTHAHTHNYNAQKLTLTSEVLCSVGLVSSVSENCPRRILPLYYFN